MCIRRLEQERNWGFCCEGEKDRRGFYRRWFGANTAGAKWSGGLAGRRRKSETWLCVLVFAGAWGPVASGFGRL
jgi:hypothetical protein